MIEIITISIIINEASKFAYYLILMDKLQNKLQLMFKLKIKFKLVNNSILIKSKLNLRDMFNLNKYVLRLITERNFRQKVRQQLKQDTIKQIEEDIENSSNMIQDKKTKKSAEKLCCVMCENQRCKSITTPEILLLDFQTKLKLKMAEQPLIYVAVDIKKISDLVMSCNDIEELNKYKYLFRLVDIECRICKKNLNNVIFTPSYIMKLQNKKEQIKFSH